MKRALFIMAGLMLTCGIAFAEVGVMIDTTNYPAAGIVRCTTGGSVGCSVSSGVLSLTGNAATITSGTINGATIGATSPSTGAFTTLSATGTITDVSIYSKASGAYPVHLMKVGADGSIYGSGTGTMLIDTGLYSATAGTGGSKALRISADGTIYAN